MAINSFDPELHFPLLGNEGGAQLRAGISYMQKKSKSREILKGNMWVVEGLCRSQLRRSAF